jgi:uncharacterized repeat protein (TIGR03843 family)
VSRDERSPQAARVSDPLALLGEGEIELVGLMPNASNYTFLARCRRGDDETLAIYKPARGESPLWDFPDGTLHRREVAAFVVARSLGWPNVPPTVLRDGPEGPGSLQRFVVFQPQQHYFTLEAARAEDFRRVALFDLVVNNADRKAGHCLLGEDDRIWVIDHGVCFHQEPKLRTVIWDFVGEPFPDGADRDLRAFLEDLESEGRAARELESLLEREEMEALATRTRRIMASGVFPEPDPGDRPFPWPPI